MQYLCTRNTRTCSKINGWSFRSLRYNKGTILKESVEYVRHLQEHNSRLLRAEDGYARLMRINWTLSRKLKVSVSISLYWLIRFLLFVVCTRRICGMRIVKLVYTMPHAKGLNHPVAPLKGSFFAKLPNKISNNCKHRIFTAASAAAASVMVVKVVRYLLDRIWFL